MNVAIAIPCYNGAAYIGKTIEAALAQSRPADEVIVVNDGSTDDSACITQRFPVRLIDHPKNLGLASARNTALQNTQADAILYVDADASAAPDLVERIIEAFADPGVAGVGGQGIEAVQNSVYDIWRRRHATQGYGSRPRQRCANLFGLCMAYRREALLAIGGFDPRYRTNAEDLDIGLRLNASGYRLAYTPHAVVYHQRKDDHSSLRKAMHAWYYWAFVVKKRNADRPWKLAAGTLKRLLWSDTWPDLFQPQGLALVRLDLEISLIKLRAISAASRETS